jgi:4-azaleucine resistance transporter AzlC
MDAMPLSNKSIIKNSLPVAFAYILLGLTFGVFFSAKGGSSLESLFISLFCFAGAAQFVALEFYSNGFSPLFMFITIFILNLRHVFYGMAFSNVWKGGHKIYLFMALTDENFGISKMYREHKPNENEWLKIFMLNHAYWIFGCFTGSLFSAHFIQRVVGAEFSLIALFVVIFASAVKKRIRTPYAIVG